MKAVRGALVVVVLLNLALLAVAAPLKGTLLRYEVSRQQRELRRLTLENRSLAHEAAVERRPDRVLSRAAALGLDLRLREIEAEKPAAAESAMGRKPAGTGPRR